MSDSEVDAWGMQIALNKLIIMGAAFKQGDSVALGEAVGGRPGRKR